MLKKLPVMLNIMPMTTAIMPQFVYDFIIFNNYISMSSKACLILQGFNICSYYKQHRFTYIYLLVIMHVICLQQATS